MKHLSDMHIHTIASHHAYSTVLENARQAAGMGLQMIAITDHCYGAPDSGNTWHFGNMLIWPRRMAGIIVLRGMEANIMSMDGVLDAAEHDMSVMDYVIASLHPYCVAPQDKNKHINALEKVLQNPLVDAIGHPADIKFDIDFDELAKLCAQAGKRLEINEHALARFDEIENMNTQLLEACGKHDTNIVLSSDAHICFEVGQFKRIDALLDKVHFPEKLIWNADTQRVLTDLKVSESCESGSIFLG